MHACLAITALFLSTFSNAAIGEERLGSEHYSKAGELVSRVVHDVVYGHSKDYLVASQVAQRIEEKRNGEIRIDQWRIEQQTFREFYDEFKKHEAIFVELRVDGATNEDIRKISELSNLKKLVLDDCEADDLSPLVKLKKLESLSIHYPNMEQLRDEKLLQKMESLRELQLISVPSLQEAIDLPLPPPAPPSAEESDKGLRSIHIYAPSWDGEPIIIPEELKQLDLSFACGEKGYVRLSRRGIEVRTFSPETSEELDENLKRLVYRSGLIENRAIVNGTRFEIRASGDADIDISPLKAFTHLEYLTMTTNGGYSRSIQNYRGTMHSISSNKGRYRGFANLDNVPLKSILFETSDLHGPSEKNIKDLELHPTLAELEHNFYSASCVLPINRLRINAMRPETAEGESLPSNMVAVELDQPNAINFETGQSPKESRWERQDYACWLGAQGNRTKASEITGEYDPKRTKDPDLGLFIWSDSDKNELTGQREYRRHGAPLKGGKQTYSESVWHIDPVSREDKGSPVYTRTVYVEGLSPGDYEVRWMVRDRSADTFLERKSDKITIRVEEKDGTLHARALPKRRR
jgi:hypothetical protein